MSAATKTPLHSVVSVICDALVELSADDQLRTLETVRIALGLRPPRVVQDRNPYRDTQEREPLPIVQVQMMNDRPVLLAGNANDFTPSGRRLRQLPMPPSSANAQAQAARGYVRPRR